MAEYTDNQIAEMLRLVFPRPRESLIGRANQSSYVPDVEPVRDHVSCDLENLGREEVFPLHSSRS